MYLIEHGAVINEENNNGEILLHMTCRNKRVKIINYLIKQGIHVDKENGYKEISLHIYRLSQKKVIAFDM